MIYHFLLSNQFFIRDTLNKIVKISNILCSKVKKEKKNRIVGKKIRVEKVTRK